MALQIPRKGLETVAAMVPEKLDFLMKLTDTKNSTLGRVLSFDDSYIGRIRRGKRGLPKNQPFIEPAAAFFAQKIREPYQRDAVAHAVCPGRTWPEGIESSEQLLKLWLQRDETPLHDAAMAILDNLSNPPRTDFPMGGPSEGGNAREPEDISFFYGNEGKRKAVIAFLSELLNLEKPLTLLLCSDEDMSWLYEDDDFAKKWAMLLMQLISKGFRIRMVHTISRDSGEMLEAVQKWLPVYMTGAIEPYYYPELRDGVYHRTLFIAETHSAIASSSVGKHTESALNLLVYRPAAVAALESEFNEFFCQCKPLMRVFGMRTSDKLWPLFEQMSQASGNSVLAHGMPSPFTVDKKVADSIVKRGGSRRLAEIQQNACARMHERLESGDTIVEILNLPTPEEAVSDHVPIPMSDLLGTSVLHYTVEEFASSIESIIDLLRQESNYHVAITREIPRNIVICAKEHVGCIVAKAQPPTTVFAVSEQRMSAAIWDHVERIVKKRITDEDAIIFLEEYLQELREAQLDAKLN